LLIRPVFPVAQLESVVIGAVLSEDRLHLYKLSAL
jgi:hypothetical protein